MFCERARIYAHRGHNWQKHGQNTLASIVSSFQSGYSVELDLRLLDGRIVLSHDPITAPPSQICTLIEALDVFSAQPEIDLFRPRLALNVKEDGLSQLLPQEGQTPHFYFDMSIPELVTYMKKNRNVAHRLSEFEAPSKYLQPKTGATIWLDAFESDWFIDGGVEEHFEGVSEIVVVSPELHRRPPASVWNWCKKNWELYPLSICTDFPDDFWAHLELSCG